VQKQNILISAIKDKTNLTPILFFQVCTYLDYLRVMKFVPLYQVCAFVSSMYVTLYQVYTFVSSVPTEMFVQ
jgi:hypothetical protein